MWLWAFIYDGWEVQVFVARKERRNNRRESLLIIVRANSAEPAVDLVTETDKAVEDMVARKLREQYPDIGYVASFTLSSCSQQQFHQLI